MMTPELTCDAFDASLPDYLERSLDAATAAGAQLHLARCERCAALVRDLDDIGSRAAELPLLTPSRDLWPGIAARIEAPVTSIDAGRIARTRGARRWLYDGAIAAALIVATAGGTYLAMRRPQAARVAQGFPPAASGTVTTVSEKPSATVTYEREIDGLRSIVRDRRSQLDPKTLAVIQRNLSVIDSAIAESRAALQHDPKNAFLATQLDRALDTKLDLLRTVALLPART